MDIFGGAIIARGNDKNSDLRINDEIRSLEVRLIGKDGQMLGVVPFKNALEMAEQEGLDLVEISPNAKPPVCKIIDYGKYLFEIAKKLKEAKKKQKVLVVKEIRLQPKIEDHDLAFKVKNANKFLSQGNKVKVTVRFRGREMAYTKVGYTILEKFAGKCEEEGSIDKRPKMEGRNMVMVLQSNKK